MDCLLFVWLHRREQGECYDRETERVLEEECKGERLRVGDYGLRVKGQGVRVEVRVKGQGLSVQGQGVRVKG
jgi:hypothetical protein